MNDWSALINEIVFSGVEDISVFSPEILVRLIVFMLMLEFMGGVFTILGKLGKAGKE